MHPRTTLSHAQREQAYARAGIGVPSPARCAAGGMASRCGSHAAKGPPLCPCTRWARDSATSIKSSSIVCLGLSFFAVVGYVMCVIRRQVLQGRTSHPDRWDSRIFHAHGRPQGVKVLARVGLMHGSNQVHFFPSSVLCTAQSP